ncbi:hypothetical protein J6590_035541 [Homalodisca vitripennis]|nr:hypothetical protein J6590_035541 [Homalodisca vitripennis]
MHITMARNYIRELIYANQLRTLFQYLKLNSALSEVKDAINLAVQRMARVHLAIEDLAAGKITSNLLPPHQFLKVLTSVKNVIPPPVKLFLDVKFFGPVDWSGDCYWVPRNTCSYLITVIFHPITRILRPRATWIHCLLGRHGSSPHAGLDPVYMDSHLSFTDFQYHVQRGQYFNYFVRPWVRRLSQDNQIKQRRAWPLLGQVTAERSCPYKRPACPAIGGGSEVTFKPLVPRVLIKLPLKNDNQLFEIFNVIVYPVYDPSLAKWVKWEVADQKLVISKDRQTYSVYSPEIFARECKFGKLTVCPLSDALLSVYKRPNCVVDLLMKEHVTLCSRNLISGLQSPVLIRTPTGWLYATSKETRVILNCFGRDANLNVSPITLKEVDAMYSSEEHSLLVHDVNETLKVLQGLDDQLGTLSVKEYSLEGTVQLLSSHYHRRMVIKYATFSGTSLVVVLTVVVLLLRWRVRVADLLRAALGDSTQHPQAAQTESPLQTLEETVRTVPRPDADQGEIDRDQSGSMSTPRTATDVKLTVR